MAIKIPILYHIYILRLHTSVGDGGGSFSETKLQKKVNSWTLASILY